MNWLYFLAGAVVSSGVTLGLAIGVFRRLVRRLEAKRGLLTTIKQLEDRRDEHDRGRTTYVRTNAGAPANIVDMYMSRPGALSLYNRTTSGRRNT